MQALRQRTASESVAVVALLLVLGAGAWSKWTVLPTLQTHVDDLMVATIIFEARLENPADWPRRLHWAEKPGVIDRIDRWLGVGLLPALTVSKNTTYAPVQFLATSALLERHDDYRAILKRGRIPSFVAGALTPLCMAMVAFRLAGWSAALIAATATAFSWELWFFSAQMENYALAALGTTLMLWRLTSRTATSGVRSMVSEALLIAALPWLQYQMLFLMPAYLAARLWLIRATTQSWRHAVGAFWPSAVVIGASCLAVIELFVAKWRGPGVVLWNAGPAREFVFDRAGHDGASEMLRYTVTFLTQNAWMTLTAMTNFVPEGHALYTAAGVLLLALALVGFGRLARSSGPLGVSVAVFIVVTAAVWLGLVLSSSITLSPTRHSLVLLPIAAILIAVGGTALGARAGNAAVTACFLAIIMAGAFALSWDDEIQRRQDPFTNEGIRAMVNAHHPDLIVTYECVENLRLMRGIDASTLELPCVFPPVVTGPLPRSEPRRLLAISGRSAWQSGHTREVQDALHWATNGTLSLPDLDRYRVQVVHAQAGDTESEATAHIANGRNGLYVTLLTAPEPSPDSP